MLPALCNLGIKDIAVSSKRIRTGEDGTFTKPHASNISDLAPLGDGDDDDDDDKMPDTNVTSGSTNPDPVSTERGKQAVDNVPVINCGEIAEAKKMFVFRLNEFQVNSAQRWFVGGRIQMPGMSLKDEICSIMCPNMTIKLKLATLETRLDYSSEQFLFHSGTENTIKDDGHFRYFAFDATHSANYVEEEIARRKSGADTKFMHVFRVKKEIPNLAFFADSVTWNNMSGRTQMLRDNTCSPVTPTLGSQEAVELKRAADALGMPVAEYNWSQHIRQLKTSTGDELNGFIATTIVSATTPKVIVEPKFELMLKVDKITEYLEHIKCYALEDYIGKVEYQKNPQEQQEQSRDPVAPATQN